MDFLKNALGIGELALGRDIADEAEFVAGLDQAAEGVLRALKATGFWQKTFAAQELCLTESFPSCACCIRPPGLHCLLFRVAFCRIAG